MDLITIKAAKRLYLLRQLKRVDVASVNLVKFYCSCIRSVLLECACQLFYSSLPQYLSDDIERIQKRAMRIIFPSLSYTDTIDENPYLTSFSTTLGSDKDHKLAELLPPRTNSTTARHDYVKGELLKFHAYVQTALKTHLSCITRRTIVNSLLVLNSYGKI